MRSYDYAHRQGVAYLSWQQIGDLSQKLAASLYTRGVQAVVGVARAGLFPATAIACSLRCDLYPVRLTRREMDQVVYDRPVWKVDVSPEVKGKIVAVVDEIADSGESLAMVARRARQLQAADTITACLFAHSWADPMPDYVGMVSDALVVFPWNQRVLVDGRWQLHPEIENALKFQGGG